MIENSRKNGRMKGIRKTLRSYYLLMIDSIPEGLCTSFGDAMECLRQYAQSRNATQLDTDIYVYDDIAGKHIITLKCIKRLRVGKTEE